MKKLVIFALLLIALTLVFTLGAFADEGEATLIPEGTPTIDGRVAEGEWEASPLLYANKKAPADCVGGDFTEERSSVTFRASWDKYFLYLLIEIEDDQLVINENTGTAYRNDSVFLYLGEYGDDHYAYNEYTVMLCLFPYFEASDYDSFNENGNTGTMICRNGYHDLSEDQYVCTVTGNETDGYQIVMEAAIALYTIEPEVGTEIAFDLQYNDSNSAAYGSTSNNREAIWTFNAVGDNNKGPHANLGEWGHLTLDGEEAPEDTTTAPAPDSTPAPEDTSAPADTTPETPDSTITPDTSDPDGTDDKDNNGGNGTGIIIAIVVAAVIAVGVAVFFVLRKKK